MKKKRSLIVLFGFASLSLVACDAFNATQNGPQITKKALKVASFLNKSVYKTGDKLELAGLRILDKDSQAEVKDYKIYLHETANTELKEGYVFEKAGTYHLVIKKDNYEDLVITDFRILVNELSLGQLRVDSLPNKKIYAVNETLDLEGLVIVDLDGKIIDEYTLILYNSQIDEGYQFKDVGFYDIYVEKKGYDRTKFTIEVIQNHRIILNTDHVKTLYKVGEEFTLEGLVVEDESGQPIGLYRSTFDEGEELNEVGIFEVEISYNDYVSASYTINVTDQSYLIVKTLPHKTIYAPGEGFNPEGIEVIDNENNVIEDLEFKLGNIQLNDTFKFTEEGDFQIDVIKEHYHSTSFTIKVTSEAITLVSLPDKLNYLVGESFDSTGLKIIQAVENYEITNYRLSIEDGHIFKHDGDIDVSVFIEKNRLAKFKVHIKEQPGLFIKKLPTKTYYEVGDRFSLDGILVENKQNFQKIVDFRSDFAENTELNEVGKKTITLTHDTLGSVSFDIEVVYKRDRNTENILTLWSVNDTHGSLYEDTENYEPGLAKVGAFFKERKDENGLILSAGDMWQGGIQSNKTHGRIMVDAMNEIGFDAMCIGNHEFDWGIDWIEENEKRMQFPFLGINILEKADNSRARYLEGSTIIDKAGIKIGIIGAGKENMGTHVTQSIVKDLDFPDPIPYVKAESDKLRNNGCDVVIYVSHDEGYDGDGESNPTKYREITEISSNSGKRYVDAMLFAHDHYRKQGVYNGVPFVEAGDNSKYFGRINLSLKADTSGEWQVLSDQSAAYCFSSYNISTEPLQSVLDLNDKYSDLIGDINEVVYTFSKSYTKEEFTYIVCKAIDWFVNDNQDKFGHRPRLSTHNTGGIRSEIDAGEMTYKDFIKIFPFENAITIQKSTDNQLSQMKRNNSIRYYENYEVSKEADGYYYCASINFLTDRFTNWQVECYYHFDMLASDALYEYLKSGLPDL